MGFEESPVYQLSNKRGFLEDRGMDGTGMITRLNFSKMKLLTPSRDGFRRSLRY